MSLCAAVLRLTAICEAKGPLIIEKYCIEKAVN